ncbi:MAG: precorrin-6y C5,15-methyltransferase (decarboxylating), CbiE subunit [Clostridia bacterium]|jgi:cobalt-precorrin-7 (C5)-methyltransferase|nr:precorrin-6y C5,15-methyltransferase (decarboxylating), CbiE subunit [Clostridia bacterium]
MIRLVGMGPGSIRYITMEAVEAIKDTDLVIAFGRIAKAAKQIRAEVQTIDRVDEIIDMLDSDRDIAILASGDPCFFGILDFLQRKGIVIDQVLPGVSSMQYMMAKLKKSWQDAALVSFHGRECSIEDIKKSKTSIVLTDSKYTPNYISCFLSSMGVKGRIYVGFNLSYKDEFIVEKEIGADIDEISTLAVVVIENEVD